MTLSLRLAAWQLEALASGCAVIVLDRFGLGGLVTPDRFEEFRQMNFAPGVLSRVADFDAVLREIDNFRPEEVASVTDRVRENCGLDRYLGRLLQSYERAMQSLSDSPVPVMTEFSAVSDGIELIAADATGADLHHLLRPYSTPTFQVLPATHTVGFAISESGALYQRGGWSSAEATGTWTDGHEAHLLFTPVTLGASRLKLEMYCRAFITPDHESQRVEIFLNGVHSESWTFTSRKPVGARWVSLGRDLSFAPFVHVTLKLPDAVSPAALGISGDTRGLGVFVEWLRLVPE
jgi:hypothetical protein